MNDFFNILFGNNTEKQEDVENTGLIGVHSLQLKDRTQKARQSLITQREENRPQPPYPTSQEAQTHVRAPYELDIDPEFQVPERPETDPSAHYSATAAPTPMAAPTPVNVPTPVAAPTPHAEEETIDTTQPDLSRNIHNKLYVEEEMSQPMIA